MLVLSVLMINANIPINNAMGTASRVQRYKKNRKKLPFFLKNMQFTLLK